MACRSKPSSFWAALAGPASLINVVLTELRTQYHLVDAETGAGLFGLLALSGKRDLSL